MIYSPKSSHGVNVPSRIYRIITDVTAHGGTIEQGAKVVETAKRIGKSEIHAAPITVEYGSSELDRSVVNKNQIREVLLAYKKAIYQKFRMMHKLNLKMHKLMHKLM